VNVWVWCSIGFNLATGLYNIAQAIRAYRRAKREATALHAAYDRIESLMPAVAVCATLANDPQAPDNWRAMARGAIPPDVKVTIDLVRAPTDRVH